MGTCIREGQSYKRHWWNDDGICELCGHKSPWALYMEQERLEHGSTRLTPKENSNHQFTGTNISDLISSTDDVLIENRKEESDVKI